MTLDKCIVRLVAAHGGVRPLARATGVDVAYIDRMLKGQKVSPSNDTLRKLGIQRTVQFRLNKAQRAYLSKGPRQVAPTPGASTVNPAHEGARPDEQDTKAERTQ